jgi:hypothetical protein
VPARSEPPASEAEMKDLDVLHWLGQANLPGTKRCRVPRKFRIPKIKVRPSAIKA